MADLIFPDGSRLAGDIQLSGAFTKAATTTGGTALDIAGGGGGGSITAEDIPDLSGIYRGIADVDFTGRGTLLLDGAVATASIDAAEFRAYPDPGFSTDPTVSFNGGASAIDFGDGASPTDTRVGRISAGIWGGLLGALVRADELGGASQNAAFFRNADNLNAGTVGLAQGGTDADNSSQAINLVWASPGSGGAGAASYRALVAADIPALDAAKITTGALALARGGTAADGSSQAINKVFASPGSGGAGAMSIRALVSDDIPALAASKITSGTLALARGGTNADNSSQAINLVWASPGSGGAGAASYRALVEADIPSLAASKIGSGNLAYARMPTGSGSWDTGAATVITITRDLTVSGATILTGGAALGANAGGSVALDINSAAANTRRVNFKTAGVLRWFLGATADAESVSNAGTNFTLTRRADDGSDLGSVFTVVRSTGAITFANAVTCSGNLIASANLSHTGSNFGVFNTAATTKKTVTGSRGGNAALASLLTQLAAYGLITDSSSA